jgi:pimeloyl-ACP methyl ester carboxylesterase
MRLRSSLALILSMSALAACAGSSQPRAAAPSGSSSASAAAAPSRPVSFTATDGVRLSGRLYGSGTTAVVLSNMGDNDPALWEAFAPKLAARGYLVMTYSFRYPPNVSPFTSDMARHTVDDLRGAVGQLRAAGATRFVLAGGSLGGMATAKVAGAVKAAAMIVLAAPVDLADYGFHVLPAELHATMPKLFVGAEQDTVVAFTETQRMFDLAASPKQIKPYAGSEHALHLLEGEHATDVAETLIAFITTKAPPIP